jgi:uncharacterized DUF497 family protein
VISIRRLEWDEWNLAHIAKHKVTPTEVEQVCTSEPLEYRQSYKDRIVVIGVTEAGRILAIILGPVPNGPAGSYYVFTARPADRKERRFYEQARSAESDE